MAHEILCQLDERVAQALDEARDKALDNLARYKFHNFGYWAAWWVKLNRLSGLKRPNPFFQVVCAARKLTEPRNPADDDGDWPDHIDTSDESERVQ